MLSTAKFSSLTFARRQVLNSASKVSFRSAFNGQKFGFKSASSLKQQSPQAPQTASPAKKTMNKFGSAFAIGGSVAASLLGVAAYFSSSTLSSEDQQHLDIKTEMLLHSAAQVYDRNRERLEGLSLPEREDKVKELERLSGAEISSLLQAYERVWEPKNGVAVLHTNQVPSNSHMEDYISVQELKCSSGSNKYMVGVFDGHSGYRCAEQLSLRMGPMVNLTLEAMSNNKEIDNRDFTEALAQFKDVTKENQISAALGAAFHVMDKELVESALEKYKILKDQSQIDNLLGPAISGSCGLVAVVDNDANEIVVANAGDCRAVVGKRLADGTWKAIRLSQDHNAYNEEELARLAVEHPGEEVIKRNRMLGNLAVTRSFGDSRYKWPLEVQQELFPAMLERGYRRATTPDGFMTPPYITAQPTLVTHKLHSTDKFMVVASDGLYDQLSDSEVVSVVGQWYDSQNIPSGKKVLDDNVATHLIRNALATDNFGTRTDEHLVGVMSIPSPTCRYYRDDISAIVLMLNDVEK